MQTLPGLAYCLQGFSLGDRGQASHSQQSGCLQSPFCRPAEAEATRNTVRNKGSLKRGIQEAGLSTL